MTTKNTKIVWEEARGMASGLVNCRRDVREPQVWRPAGMPMKVADDCREFVAEFPLDAETTAVLTMKGMQLGVAILKESSSDSKKIKNEGPDAQAVGEITRIKEAEAGLAMPEARLAMPEAAGELGQVEARVIGCEVVEEGFVRIFLKHSRSVYMSYSRDAGAPGGWRFTMHGRMPAMPPLLLRQGRRQTISETVSGLKLSQTLTGGSSRLSATETASLSKRVAEAYVRLKQRASAAGYSLQPRLARVRVEDRHGDTIATGPIILVCSPDGPQCTGGATFTLDSDGQTLQASALMANAYNLELSGMRQIAEPWRRMACRAVVETSAQIEPYDPAGSAGTPAIASDGRTITVAMPLPGMAGSKAGIVAAVEKRALKALQAGEWMEQASIADPFGGEIQKLTIPLSDLPAARGVNPAPERDAESFRAMYAAPGGEIIATDPLTEPFDGHTPAQLLTQTAASAGSAWRAVATVALRDPDGTMHQAVRVAEGSDENPLGFSPLLTYPDERATSIRLAIKRGGTNVEQTYAMRPVRGSGIACHISLSSPTLMPSQTVADLDVGATTAPARCDAGIIATATASTLSDRRLRHRLGTGSIDAVAEWPAGSGSWDFSRTRLALATRSGIYQLTLDANGRVHATRRMSALTADGGRLTECTDLKGRFLLMLSGGRPAELRGSKVALLPGGIERAREAAYGGKRSEYWWTETGADGATRLMHGQLRDGTVERIAAEYPGISGEIALRTWQGHLLILAGGGATYCADIESWPEEGVRMALRLRHDFSGYGTGIAGRPVRAAVFGSGLSGSIAIAADRGSRRAAMLAGFKVSGDLTTPIVAPLATGYRPWIELQADLTVGSDAEVRPLAVARRQSQKK